MAEVDLVLVGMVLVLVGFAFFLYLLIRRTVVDFKKGMNEGK